MTNAQNAPPVTEGSGRVVSAAPVSQPRPTSSRRPRRTNLLSSFTPEERRVFLQERLNQSALFRQIAATKHGVTAPIEREVIGEAPLEEEYEDMSRSYGVSVEEVRRLEQLARREAMLEVREEVLRRTKGQAADSSGPAESPQSEKYAEDAARDEQVQRRLAADRQRRHEQRMEELDRQIQAAERQRAYRDEHVRDDMPSPQSGQPLAAQGLPWYRRRFSSLFTGLGGTALGTLGALAIMWVNSLGAPVVLPADASAHGGKQAASAVVVGNDKETLLLLQANGLAAPVTPLGEKILEAFKTDPDLRAEVMRRVEDTLLQK